MMLGNVWGPSFYTPSFGFGGCGYRYGSSMFNSCHSYSGGFCSPSWGWNPYGSMMGGMRGSMVGSAVGGLLGLGVGAIGGGPWGAMFGGAIGSSFGSSLGYLAGSVLGAGASPYCW